MKFIFSHEENVETLVEESIDIPDTFTVGIFAEQNDDLNTLFVKERERWIDAKVLQFRKSKYKDIKIEKSKITYKRLETNCINKEDIVEFETIDELIKFMEKQDPVAFLSKDDYGVWSISNY
jgi:hypothetical protein